MSRMIIDEVGRVVVSPDPLDLNEMDEFFEGLADGELEF